MAYFTVLWVSNAHAPMLEEVLIQPFIIIHFFTTLPRNWEEYCRKVGVIFKCLQLTSRKLAFYIAKTAMDEPWSMISQLMIDRCLAICIYHASNFMANEKKSANAKNYCFFSDSSQ